MPELEQQRAEAAANQQFYRQVARLHAFGARVLAEMLAELAREWLLRVAIEEKVRSYTERLDDETVRALGADRTPPPIHAIK